MNKGGIVFLLLAAMLILASCDNDDGVTPVPFALTIEVVDTDGAPVPGLDLSLAANIPYYQDDKSPSSRARVIIPFTAAVSCSLRVLIEDVTGVEIRELVNSSISAGQHRMEWDGHVAQDVQLPSGVYTVHSVAMSPGTAEILHEARVSMYMAIIDPARVCVGTTDADGLIELTDKRLFPHLYDTPDIPATDETGTQIGLIQFSDSMRFGFADLVGGGLMRFYEDVTGSGTLQFVWTGNKTPSARMAMSEPFGEVERASTDVEFELGRPFPCPFN